MATASRWIAYFGALIAAASAHEVVGTLPRSRYAISHRYGRMRGHRRVDHNMPRSRQSSSTQPLNRLVRFVKKHAAAFGRAYLPLFSAGVVGIYLKTSLMQDYWFGIAALYGQKELPARIAFGYFSFDIFVNFVVLPFVGVAVAILIFRKWAPLFTTVAACSLIVFYFVQLRAQQDVGQYLSLTMMLEAARFAVSEPELAASYVPVGALVKLFLALLVTVIGTLFFCWAARSSRATFIANIGLCALAAMMLSLVAAAVTVFPTEITGLHRSVPQKILASLVADTGTSARGAHSLEENLRTFRAMTATPIPATDDALAGKEAASNVLYFVMETGPSDVFPDTDATELIPPELAQNTLTAYRHQTTYPYTSDAIFSILSGFYPDGRRELVAKGGFKKHRTLFAQLRSRGYHTGAYVQGITDDHVEEKMLRQFGVDTVFVANRQTNDSPELRTANAAAATLTERILQDSPHFIPARKKRMLSLLSNDLHALEKMKSDMRSTLRAGKKFAYLYLPQIGHGPWLEIGKAPTTKAYGRALMNLQSAWLRELATLLKEEGALANTTIVFTADHGVRTRAEDSAFNVGTISSYSFHVPLFLFAPNAFKAPLAVRNMTSHIDIESSMSVLLGSRAGSAHTEGVPLWESPPNRRLYFFAESYGGADGFYQGDYFSNNVITETQFQNSTMNFTGPGLNVTDPAKREFVTGALRDFKQMHRAIIWAQ